MMQVLGPGLRARLINVLTRAVSRPLRRLVGRKTLPEAVQRILVFQLQQLGDSVVFTPALRAVRARFPNAKITLLASGVSGQFYSRSVHVDELCVEPRGRLALARLLLRLRRKRFDLSIADTTQVSLRYAILSTVAGARVRIGFDVDNRGFLYNWPLPPLPDLDLIDSNLTIAKVLGAVETTREVDCYFDENDAAVADSLLSDGLRRPFIVMHVASNWQSKTWEVERWAAVATRLIDQFQSSIILVGTERERGYIELVAATIPYTTTSLIGRTTLPQLAALLTRCDLFIGTDSGPRHVAAAAKCPQVTIMSAQDKRGRWEFNRESELVLRTEIACSPCFQAHCSHRSCMLAIDVERVFQACVRMLSRGTRSPDHTGAPTSVAAGQ